LPQALKFFWWRNRNGTGVAGLAVLGLTSFFSSSISLNGTWTSTGHDNRLRNIGRFSLGAESIALFARVGGGIYKTADVELI
jgi:Na+/H+-translocating membrane pyrophosphatase